MSRLPLSLGFVNNGDTCFMNCVLQTIFATPAMLRYGLSGGGGGGAGHNKIGHLYILLRYVIVWHCVLLYCTMCFV